MFAAFDTVIYLPISKVSNKSLVALFVVVIVPFVFENATLVSALTAVLSSCVLRLTSVSTLLSILFAIQHRDTR